MDSQSSPTLPVLPPDLVRTLWRAGLIAVVASSMACGSGLDAYGKDTSGDTMDYDEEEDIEPISDEDCATQCAVAIAQLDDLMEGDDACILECGVGIGTSFDGSALLSLLFPLLGVYVEGELQVGGSCELYLECTTPCQDLLLSCMEANPTDEDFVGACMDEYGECLVDAVCEDDLISCGIGVSEAYDACLDGGTDPAECLDLWLEGEATCSCIYIACVDGGDPLACVDTPPAPLPLKTGPDRFDVPRAFVNAHAGRLQGISTEVFLIPRVDEAKDLLGIELGSIQKGDALHALGLRDGDVVRGINGITAATILEHPMAALSLFDGQQFQVPIFRNNSSRVLRYRVTD